MNNSGSLKLSLQYRVKPIINSITVYPILLF